MARFAVLCVLFACFAVAVYSQATVTCDPQTGLISNVASRAIVVDAVKVANIVPVLNIGEGTGSLSLDYQKNQGFKTTANTSTGVVTVVRTPPPITSAPRIGGISVLVTFGLAVLALLSQRGSLVAVVLALSLATIVLASCVGSVTRVEVNMVVDPATLDRFTLRVAVNPTTRLCPNITLNVTAPLNASEIVKTVTTTACEWTWTNPLPGCKRCPAIANQASVTCVNNQCSYTCDATHQLCGGDCSTLIDDPASCGDCTTDCSSTIQNAVPACTNNGTAYVCTYAPPCTAGYNDCNNNTADGCEANTAVTATDCGVCGNDCSALPNINPNNVSCVAGNCVVECDAGYQDCSAAVAGCESQVTDNNNCGICGNNCASTVGTNAAAGTCNATSLSCIYPTCNTGFGDCSAALGCETDLTANVANCGACGNNCQNLPNVLPSSTCVNSACNIVCAAGFKDCDGNVTNGCETNLNTNVNNCGDCNTACGSLPNIVNPVCTNGVCGGTCAAGFQNCGTSTGVGCPTNVATNASNCGTCGNTCPNVKNAAVACVSQNCTYTTCTTGYQDCDNLKNNGCESLKATDTKNCGTCGTDCAVSGALGNFASAPCTNGVCSVVCQTGYTDCDKNYVTGCEIHTNNDVKNCGACNNTCALKNANTQQCNVGVCEVVNCTSGFALCNNPPTAGCVINLNSDPNNCKSCDNKCSTLANVASGITCSGGVCQVATNCAAGFNDCNNNVADGCELPATICTPVTPGGACSVARGYTNPAYNGFNCASLGAAQNVVSSTCAIATTGNQIQGQCFITCAATHDDCDGNPLNGCENPTSNCGSAQTSGTCQTALKDPAGPSSCLALATNPTLNVTVTQGGSTNVCNPATGLCTYTCNANYFDCDQSARNGCEIDKRICPTNSVSDCVFANNTRCGYGVCADCSTISGTVTGTSRCVAVNSTYAFCNLTNLCNASLCRNADNDWSNGCEQARFYLSTVGIGLVDCSKDIDLTNILIVNNQPVYCEGNSSSPFAGRCRFTCKPGFADCDGSPLNGCETALSGNCQSCEYQADVSCGKNKCVDCTLLEGTLGVDYANPRHAAASASTCLPYNVSINERVTDYYCDTSVHYLHPRFDPPTGDNGACQSELCRDLDGNWENGCESAQQYGRGRFYYYGDSTNLDSYMIPYVPNPYEDRFYEYKELFTEWDTNTDYYANFISDDIKILNYIKPLSEGGVTPNGYLPPGLQPSLRWLVWPNLVGVAAAPGVWYLDNSNGFSFPLPGIPGISDGGSTLNGQVMALLHYQPLDFAEIDDPAEAAALAIIGEPYETPVDCVLSEWSDWGLCTYEDDCIKKDYVLQTRIRTRSILTQASGGGVCHLPLVEDFYRFSHRNSRPHNVTFVDGFFRVSVDGTWAGTNSGNYGTDFQHGGGFGYRVDYTGGDYQQLPNFDIQKILHWNAEEWDVENLWNSNFVVNDPKSLSWTGVVQAGTNNASADLLAPLPDQYGRLLTCVAIGTCPDTNLGLPKVACNITAWSEWSQCSARCDGDWAGGVRIRTRTVLRGAAALGECFVSEFDAVTGLPLIPNAGMLYEEDWQCNDHSCSSYDCTQLKNPTFAAQAHIDLGADKIVPTCDGRDWPAYVNDIAWVDVNRDGRDDNVRYTRRGPLDDLTTYEIDGNFPLWNTIYNFSYEYRWPGHCLYECVEGWFDCDHDPRNGCETSGDFCSIDVEFGSPTQLKHPVLPWEHPHGECTIAWKHDDSGVIARDCTGFNQQFDDLRHTTHKCVSATGKCDTTCEHGYFDCGGDGCVRIDDTFGYCGYNCIQCDQLNIFKYGYQQSSPGTVPNLGTWRCQETEDQDDWECVPATQCIDGCRDDDNDIYNGCETAVYEQWPYPDVEPQMTELDAWSSWTPCTHSDECGYLWDISPGVGVFRNVPIQTRYRRPVKSAYNGGWYPDFKYFGKGALEIDGVEFPTNNDFIYQIGTTPALNRVLGVPLVQTPFYEVRVCPQAVAPCIECTNQLEGLEEHCVLSAWSDWSACSAECIDRFKDPEFHGVSLDNVVDEYYWDITSNTGLWVTDRIPYQIRTRTVTKPARRGGRCPPPGDTWQLAEAASNVEIFTAQTNNDYTNYALGGLADSINFDAGSGAVDNAEMSAKASYLVDVRKCNTDKCRYPENCDSLNYWYPGHFQTIATCGQAWDNEISRCVANTGFNGVKQGCDVSNGYCDTYNGDLRDGCDTYVYPTHCGAVNAESCDYDNFHDCTTLPGVMTPYSAPCVINPAASLVDASLVDITSANTHTHVCDIRWACNATLCTNENSFSRSVGWADGCEIARNYRYPFVTVKTSFLWDGLVNGLGNPMSHFYPNVVPGTWTAADNLANQETTIDKAFWDPRNKYTLDAAVPTDNSIAFAFDCHGALLNSWFCGDDQVDQPVVPEGEILNEDGDVVSRYNRNAGCHLSGLAASDAFNDLGFGCNGVWNTPNAGMCVMKCAPGFYDADLDPRNGCETDTIDRATPEDKYVWVGNCQASGNTVEVRTDASCGADKCVNCRGLPGTPTTGVPANLPSCVLVEEKQGKIPVLSNVDTEYYSIQYACGVLTGSSTPLYAGRLDFNNRYCNALCADGDMDWRNGCEQGRGYTAGSAGYVMGGVYDALFDSFDYSEANDPACDANFVNGAGIRCDKRSSGFEYPIPGAWFYQNISGVQQDVNSLGTSSRPASQLDAWIADMATFAGYFGGSQWTTVNITSKRAFDCSLLYSTELSYGLANGTSTPANDIIRDKYRFVGFNQGIWTFGQVHNINVTRYPGGLSNNVCNLTTGLCNYVCNSGWDDYDLDPSNGCEADLSGPCGTPTALVQRSYTQTASCGPTCVDCRTLPGSYTLPTYKSECLAILPAYYDNAVPGKHDYLVENVRFVHTCVTEVIKPSAEDTFDAWKSVVCDPLSCFDANFEYEDGCELATDYPASWAQADPKKASFNHWFSPVAENPRQKETTYWLRDDGRVAIGRSTTPPTPSTDSSGEPTGDYWVRLFDLDGVPASTIWNDDYFFNVWDITAEIPAWTTKQWGYNPNTNPPSGYNIFPTPGLTASYDCSNTKVPSGEDAPVTVDLGLGSTFIVNVDWTLTSAMKGPWFHVNQSRAAVTQCDPGQDPGAIRNLYARGGFGIDPLTYCAISTQQSNAWTSGGYSKACYDAWVWPGSGLCALACETDWKNADMDPTNGCESYIRNGLPYPASNCGLYSQGTDPSVDIQYPNGNYNYNQQASCGAGVCLSCQVLGGVNHAATSNVIGNDVAGLRSTCVDGGDDWFAADASVPSSNGATGVPTVVAQAIKYPGDYYCTGILNQKSCLRTQLGIRCTTAVGTCDQGFLWANVSGGTQTTRSGARYLQVCTDRDGLWETGCEVALGYNLDLTTNGTATFVVPGLDGSITIIGDYDRKIGVKPNWDSRFNTISWPGNMLAGFDCESLRLLPREHTHVRPQNGTQNKIECALGGNQGDGTCTFTCDRNWVDCDGNPWNGCEASDLLCGGAGSGTAGCQTAQRYVQGLGLPTTGSLDCTILNRGGTELARDSYCDSNQIPYDDRWHLYWDATSGSNNYDDASVYEEPFDVQDHGLNEVDVLTNRVDPSVSRYTIKGYWDNVDIDYSCRVWLDSYTVNGVTLRTKNISDDANAATGRCVVDCRETGGYSDCNGDDFDGCESHRDPNSCRTSEGTCINCVTLPGIATINVKCLSTTGGFTPVNIKTFSIVWAPNVPGIQGTTNYIVTYGSNDPASGIPEIGTEFPQCDTRGESALGTRTGQACDDNLCRDYDGDWENGCEFPMTYTVLERAQWETPQALYQGTDASTGAVNGEVFDGFDCSWIADPQPDAGGRNYGGLTWAQKYHVNTNVSNGGSLGSCIGDQNLPNAGKCDIICVAGWSDCDGDPTNGCENDNSLCENCVFAKGYPDRVLVNCSSLVDAAKGFVPFSIPPTCNGREGEDGQCSHYLCNIFNGYCDAGLGKTLTSIGCIDQTADDQYCGADWNHRAIEGNMTTIPLTNVAEYDGGRMIDYGNFDGTGRCGNCNDLDGFHSDVAYCQWDPPVAGHTYDKKTYYKPAASGWIDNSLGSIEFDVAGNTVGEYLCQLHGALGAGDDGACDRDLCVDEDYFWANGCETAVGYPIELLVNGQAGGQRHVQRSSLYAFGFDYHFAYNDDVFGLTWPHNAARDGVQTSGALRSQLRGIWCPFLQFWSLSTDNYETGDCDVFPCPHFHPSTITNWISCVNNATSPDAGKCNFQCNLPDGWDDCDDDPMTGCETDIFNDGTCGSGCERVECNALDGLNPFYWSECLNNAGVASCDLSICEDTLCRNADGNWTNGCETALNYPGGATYNCRALMEESERRRLHLATVEACNGEPGHHWAGKCEFTCEHGWVDCNGNFADGCEHDGSLCQDCTKALGYVTHFDGADFWQFWGPSIGSETFYSVVYGSRFTQDTLDWDNYTLVNRSFLDNRNHLQDQFAGPDVPYARFHEPYVAAFDCSLLQTIYPGHFTAGNITCDSNVQSPTAGRCVYSCNAANGYFDCDGDPRNGCEHQSSHEACGGNGACRNCYYISGVDYPVDQNLDGINDGSRGPYGRAGIGAFGIGNATLSDVYDDPQVKYFGVIDTIKNIPSPEQSPLRLGCVRPTGQSEFTCNLDTCVVLGATVCIDANQGTPGGWRDGCERALGYDFNNSAEGKYFDCSLMGPNTLNNDAPRPTNQPGTPSFHVRQVVGTVGCDGQAVTVTNNSSPFLKYAGKGAWRYILARTGRVTDALESLSETEGRWAFDYDGLEEFFLVNDDLDLVGNNTSPVETLDDLESTVADFVLYRVRGSDKPGTCYYECEFGYEDCNGDPRDGCEIKLSACRNADNEIGWDWTNKRPFNGCELALGYTHAQLGITDPDQPAVFSCLSVDPTNLAPNTPVYCRGGQDGNLAQLGTCQFTCASTHEDCNGQPGDGCESPISSQSCGCVNCEDYLPGTESKSLVPTDGDFAVSKSTCNVATRQCSLPCNASLCVDADGDWMNGCEVAKRYPQQQPRNSTPIGDFDCSIWAKNLLLAKKQHIDVDKLDEIFCEGRATASDAGTCSYQGACLQTNNGGFHDYQDCNSDPRDGCEDTNRWCQVGQSATTNPRGTRNDKCSKALNYFRDANGFDALDQLRDSGVSRDIPAFECLILAGPQANTIYHVNVSAVFPYCDRDASHIATRGDCVFVCNTGFADCDGLATNGCEATVSNVKTCDYDCVNCDTLPGIDRTQAHNCVANTGVAGRYVCQYTCPGGAGSSNCADRDGKWQNGCERALNGDIDNDGVFVNQGDFMDCSVMNEEAKVNPELFRHHLHIDLTVPVPTAVDAMPPGSIFCNNDIIPGAPFGKCHFICIPGFENFDRNSYNGCEAANQTGGSPLGYRFEFPGVVIPLEFGGFMIGDYEVEYYMAWLSRVAPALGLPIKAPMNVALFNWQLSAFALPPALWPINDPNTTGLIPILWY